MVYKLYKRFNNKNINKIWEFIDKHKIEIILIVITLYFNTKFDNHRKEINRQFDELKQITITCDHIVRSIEYKCDTISSNIRIVNDQINELIPKKTVISKVKKYVPLAYDIAEIIVDNVVVKNIKMCKKILLYARMSYNNIIRIFS